MKHIITLSIAVLFLGNCGQQAAPTVIPPKVGVTPAGQQNLKPNREFLGRLNATQNTSIRPRLSGYIQSIAFKEGDLVKKDHVLFTLDADQAQINKDRAAASLAKAQAELKIATKSYERGKTLRAQDALSINDFDEMEARFHAAEALVAEAKALLAQAEWERDHCTIKAPFAGHIGKSLVSVGDLVSPNSEPLATLLSVDPMYVEFDVSEKLIHLFLKKQQEEGQAEAREKVAIRLLLPDDSMYPETGKIIFVDNQVNGNTGSVLMRATIANKNRELIPGMFVRVLAEKDEELSMLTVAINAVQEDQQGPFVLVVNKENMVIRRDLSIEKRFDNFFAIKSGLTEGERVITEGIQKVRVGQTVDVMNAQATHSTSADTTIE